MNNEICRIVKYEAVSGTFYHAERHVLKKRWFRQNEWVWEKFYMHKNSFGYIYFKKMLDYEYTFITYKDHRLAEFYCEQWARASQADEVIKVWSINDGSN
jgi:hypothetical protein